VVQFAHHQLALLLRTLALVDVHDHAYDAVMVPIDIGDDVPAQQQPPLDPVPAGDTELDLKFRLADLDRGKRRGANFVPLAGQIALAELD
jgi:hypothetical protein